LAATLLADSLDTSSNGRSVANVISAHGIDASERTCFRILHQIQTEANGGERLEQFQKIGDFLQRLKHADTNAYVDVELSCNHEFIRCFVAWGFSRFALDHVKPLVIVDGTHLSVAASGTVCSSFFTFKLCSYISFLTTGVVASCK